jgi:hypothetical protein
MRVGLSAAKRQSAISPKTFRRPRADQDPAREDRPGASSCGASTLVL